MSTLKHSPKYEFSCFPQILHLKHEQSKGNDQCESAHFYFQIYAKQKIFTCSIQTPVSSVFELENNQREPGNRAVFVCKK